MNNGGIKTINKFISSVGAVWLKGELIRNLNFFRTLHPVPVEHVDLEAFEMDDQERRKAVRDELFLRELSRFTLWTVPLRNVFTHLEDF